MNRSPNDTNALLIGIGRYSAWDVWNLPAAVPDALRFLSWHLDGGLMQNRIGVLLSPTNNKAESVVSNGLNSYQSTGGAIVFNDECPTLAIPVS
jgi:hypothetical protein